MVGLHEWMFVRFCCVLWLITLVGSDYSDYIPIGAVFDHSASETRAGFNYQIQKNNDAQGRLRLSAVAHEIDMRNAYNVSKSMCRLMKNGLFVLFGTHTAQTLNLIRSYTKTFRLPYISPSMPVNRSGQELGYELYMRPMYTLAIMDLIKHYGWTTVYYVYDSDEGLQRLQQLFDALAEDQYVVKMNMLRVSDVEDAYNAIMGLDRLDGDKRIILDMPTKDTEEIMLRQKTDTRRVKYHFLLANLDIHELELTDYNHGGINITGFRIVNFSNVTTKRFLEGWRVLNPESWPGAGRAKLSYEAALAVDAVSLVSRALSKMLQRNPDVFRNTLKDSKVYNNGTTEGIDCDAEPVVPWKHGYDIMKTMREVEFYGLSGRIAFDSFGLRREYELDMLEVNLNRGLAQIGKWNPRLRLGVGTPNPVRMKGNNTMANVTRIVTSILTSPYLMPRTGDNLVGNDQFEGYCADLAKKIAEFVQFKYILEPVKDGAYGAQDDNGTWNGMVGVLVRNEADLAIAPLTITSQRERVIDFSKPFMSLGISIMIKKPEKEIPGVFSFMYPLSYEIWMCVIFAYIGVSVVLFLVSRFSPFEWHIEDNTDGPTVTNNFTIFNSLWFSLGAFMQQGCDIEPRSVSGRIVGSVWWFFTLIIISSYTANLAAFLTVERMQSPIESADDLAKQTEIKYGVVKYGSTENFFKMSSIPVYERMWAFMSSADPPVTVESNEEGTNRVRSSNGRYAFLVESTTNDYINQRRPCDTMKVGSNLDSKGYGIGTPLGSDLRDRITLAVLELREKGQLQKLEKKWWYEKGECGKQSNKKKDTGTSARSLDNVVGLFYILVGGMVLSLFVAVLEFLYKSKIEANRKQTTFSNAMRTKARLSIKGTPDTNGAQAQAVGGPSDMPPANMSMSTYTYAPAAQLISLDGYADGNTHTQV